MRAVPLRTVRQADAPAKLALLESLLGVAEVGECIDRTLSWLGAHTHATQAICALATADSGQLRGVAGHRVTMAQVESVSVGLDDTIHPLNRAMEAGEPTRIGSLLADRRREGTSPAAGPFGRSPYWALPLETYGAGQPAGGLLLVVLEGAPSDDVTWIADVLSQKLHILLTRDALAEGQNKFRRERSLLDAIINAVADPILLTDTEGRLLIANSRAEALFSTAAGVSEGRRRAVELNNMFLSAALWRIAVGAGQVKPQELLVVDPVDGSDLLFELLGTVVHDQREGTGIVSVLRNVTDLRRATEELSENYRRMRMAEAEARTERDRLDVIIDSVGDPIIVSDDAGKVTLMNAPAERLFTSASDDEAVQRRLRANDAHFSSFIAGLLSEGSEVRRRGEVSLTELATGMPLPFEAIAGKVLSEVGEFVAVVTILHDRSEALERARLYEQVKRGSDELEARVVAATAELARQNTLLRHQAVELEQASALKSQFLANMSHEFRTPLNAILGYASILLQGISGDLTPAQRKALDRIASNGRHLVGIISEILDLSRIEAGRMPLQVSTFALKQLVEEVQAEMEPIIVRSKLAVSSHVPADFAPIVSDRQKIKQILLNLLSNALKFTREGSVTIRAASAEPDLVTISIADTGIGIDPADHEKIFEDFHQVDSSVARPYGGTGLGLSICRRLATMLGGRLEMESEVGRGSTFTLFLASRLRK